jgi:hypothetical protein
MPASPTAALPPPLPAAGGKIVDQGLLAPPSAAAASSSRPASSSTAPVPAALLASAAFEPALPLGLVTTPCEPGLNAALVAALPASGPKLELVPAVLDEATCPAAARLGEVGLPELQPKPSKHTQKYPTAR